MGECLPLCPLPAILEGSTIRTPQIPHRKDVILPDPKEQGTYFLQPPKEGPRFTYNLLPQTLRTEGGVPTSTQLLGLQIQVQGGASRKQKPAGRGRRRG